MQAKGRSTRGKRAFTDSEELEIYQAIVTGSVTPEQMATAKGCTSRTIENAVARVKKRLAETPRDRRTA